MSRSKSISRFMTKRTDSSCRSTEALYEPTKRFLIDTDSCRIDHGSLRAAFAQKAIPAHPDGPHPSRYESRVAAYRENHRVGATSLGHIRGRVPQHPAREASIEGSNPKLDSYSKPLGEYKSEVINAEPPPLRARTLNMMPIGPCPMARTVSPRLQAQCFDTLHAGVDGFHEAGLLEGNAVRNAHGAVLDDPIHNSNVLSETAAGRLESSRAPDLFIGGALGEGLVSAIETLAARDVVKDHHAIAGAVGSRFRPRPPRCRRSRGRRCAGPNESRWKSSSGRCRRRRRNEPELTFLRADARDWNSLQPDIVDAPIDGCLHRRRNRLRIAFNRVGSGSCHGLILDDVQARIASKGDTEGNGVP